MVMAQEMVSPPTVPVLLHSLSPTPAALAELPAPAVITSASTMGKPSATTTQCAMMRNLPRKQATRFVIRSTSQS
jgi:hypothetical protein